MREDTIGKDIAQIEDATIRKACELLRDYNGRIDTYLAEIVASLCNVNVEHLLTVTNQPQYAHARWFYWYAYRHMTGEDYNVIVSLMRPYRKYSRSMVEYAIGRMAVMVSNDPIWMKRWGIIKKVIDIILSNNEILRK